MTAVTVAARRRDTAGPVIVIIMLAIMKEKGPYDVPRVKELLGSTASSAQRGKLADEQALRTSHSRVFREMINLQLALVSQQRQRENSKISPR
jgi:hypothetical protein